MNTPTCPNEASVEEKLGRLRDTIRSLESVAVAFSGGVDSSLVAKVAAEELGERAALVTARSETYPEFEFGEARRFAERLGARHVVIETQELEIEGFSENPPDRCYHCKRELFGRVRQVADELGLKHVADGANADDTGDFRPGLRAGCEMGVRSPLREAGLTKDDVRAVSKRLGLATWDKPAYACLSSRFPYGETITAEKVTRVGKAEDFLRGLGFAGFRVRSHGDIARIELAPGDIERVVSSDLRERVHARLREQGFAYVTLDLRGYRTGSMNETLSEAQKAAARAG